MKKRFLISLLLVLLVFIFIYWYNYSGKMISKNVEDISNITVTLYPFDEEKKETRIIDDTYEIKKIYNILNETTKIQNDRIPLHDAYQWDPKFEIDVIYKNGEKDYFFSTEATGSIYKFINHFIDTGYKGYKMGENQLIWDYIFSK